jgi:hypothetical protein
MRFRTRALLLLPWICVAQTQRQPPGTSTSTVVDIRAYGVAGDGVADDTAAFNAACAGAADGTQIVIPGNLAIRITDTVRCSNKASLSIKGLSVPGQDHVGNARIVWDGADGGTMLALNRVDGGVIENLYFLAASPCSAEAGSHAANAIVLDQAGPSGHIMTNYYVRHNTMHSCEGGKRFVGVSLSPVSFSNVEHMTVSENTIFCSFRGKDGGVGIRIGNNANAKGEQFDRNNITGCTWGIGATNGSWSANANQMQSNGIAFYNDNYLDFVSITNTDAESNDRFYVGAGIVPVYLANNRMGGDMKPPAGHALIESRHATVISVGNSVDVAGVRMYKGYDEAALVSIGNSLPDGDLRGAGYNTFQASSFAIQDHWRNLGQDGKRGFTGLMASCSSPVTDYNYPLVTAGSGTMYFDCHVNKWMFSNNGGPVVELAGSGVSRVSALPACNAAAEGQRRGVRDALNPAPLAKVRGGGEAHVGVYCNGSSWIVQ